MGDTKNLRARLRKLEANLLQWEQRLQSPEAGPEEFDRMLRQFRESVDDIGRVGFRRLAQACEIDDDTVVHQGRIYRFKQDVPKEWMTLWGKVQVPRRLYQPDRGGPSWGPLDERCGMNQRFMVPSLERVTALLGAQLVPAEVETTWAELLPEPPSRTAIQNLLTTVGQYAEDHAEQLELALQDAAPLKAEADTLVVSWDGVHVPLREPAPKRGRPAERPTDPDLDPAPTAWKEAGVGMVATYQTPLESGDEPQSCPAPYNPAYMKFLGWGDHHQITRTQSQPFLPSPDDYYYIEGENDSRYHFDFRSADDFGHYVLSHAFEDAPGLMIWKHRQEPPSAYISATAPRVIPADGRSIYNALPNTKSSAMKRGSGLP